MPSNMSLFLMDEGATKTTKPAVAPVTKPKVSSPTSVVYKGGQTPILNQIINSKPSTAQQTLNKVISNTPAQQIANSLPKATATSTPAPAAPKAPTVNTGAQQQQAAQIAAAQAKAQAEAQAQAALQQKIASDLQKAIDRIIYPDKPELRSAQSMADLLGITYDRGEFENLMRDSAEKKYANLDNEFGRTQDMFYDQAANSANLLMGALRRGDRDAAMTGTTRGAQQAQELSALLGVSADNAMGATELAQGRSDLVHQRETEMAEVAEKALKMYNDLGLNLGQLSASELGHNAVIHSGEYAAMAGLEGMLRQILSNDANHASGLQNNIDVAKIQADAQKAAASAQAAASKAAGGSWNPQQNNQAQIEMLTGLMLQHPVGSTEYNHYLNQLTSLGGVNPYNPVPKPNVVSNNNKTSVFNPIPSSGITGTTAPRNTSSIWGTTVAR